MRRIDLSFLNGRCAQPPAEMKCLTARDLIDDLGNLASWWLDPQVYDRAQRPWMRPALSHRPGDAVVLLAVEGAAWPALRRAVGLPLRWLPKRDGDRSDLPPKLQQLAADVRHELAVAKALEQMRDAQLTAHPIWQGLDLSGLTALSVDSAWASLAAALLAQSAGGRSNPHIFASAAWKRSVVHVEGLAHKLELAADLGGTDFFLPSSQVDTLAETARATGMRLHGLAEGVEQPLEAMEPLSARFEVPPDKGAPLEDRLQWYNAIVRRRREHAESYYREQMLLDLIVDVKKRFETTEPPADTLVSILSFSTELPALIAGALGVKSCLLLYQPNKKGEPGKDKLDLCKYLLEKAGVEVLEPYRLPTEVILAPAIFQAVEERLSNGGSGVFDLTTGTKTMTLGIVATAMALQRPMVYLESEHEGKGVNRPEEMKLHLLPASSLPLHYP